MIRQNLRSDEQIIRNSKIMTILSENISSNSEEISSDIFIFEFYEKF